MAGAKFPLVVLVALQLGGCSLVVDFDRSLLNDGGADAGVDAEVEAGSEAMVDEPVEAAPDEVAQGR